MSTANKALSDIFTERLLQRMKEQSVTQAQLATAVGVQQSTVSKWVNGTFPGADYLAAISKTLNTSPSWLLGWEEGARDVVRITATAAELAERYPGTYAEKSDFFQQAVVCLGTMRNLRDSIVQSLDHARDDVAKLNEQIETFQKLILASSSEEQKRDTLLDELAAEEQRRVPVRLRKPRVGGQGSEGA